MLKTLSVIGFALAATAAAAQVAPPAAPDPVFLGKAINALVLDRNEALDRKVMAEAKAAMLQDEVDKLKKQIEAVVPPVAPKAQ